MPPEIRLNQWTPLEQPWDTPMSQEDQENFAMAAVISGADSEAAIVALFSDHPQIFVNASRLATA